MSDRKSGENKTTVMFAVRLAKHGPAAYVSR
jgi:hypothetical protein